MVTDDWYSNLGLTVKWVEMYGDLTVRINIVKF